MFNPRRLILVLAFHLQVPAEQKHAARWKNWSTFDLDEYKVAAVSRGAEMGAADAATQTDEGRRGRHRNAAPPEQETVTTELGIDEILLPPSSSSPDMLEMLIQHDARLATAVVGELDTASPMQE